MDRSWSKDDRISAGCDHLWTVLYDHVVSHRIRICLLLLFLFPPSPSAGLPAEIHVGIPSFYLLISEALLVHTRSHPSVVLLFLLCTRMQCCSPRCLAGFALQGTSYVLLWRSQLFPLGLGINEISPQAIRLCQAESSHIYRVSNHIFHGERKKKTRKQKS